MENKINHTAGLMLRQWVDNTTHKTHRNLQFEAIDLIEHLQQELQALKASIGELEYQAESAECAHMVLDDYLIDRVDDGNNVYSLAGRIGLLKASIPEIKAEGIREASEECKYRFLPPRNNWDYGWSSAFKEIEKYADSLLKEKE